MSEHKEMNLHPDNGPELPRALCYFWDNPSRTAVWISVVLMLYQAALPGGLTLDLAARTFSWHILPSESFHLSKMDIIGNVVPYSLFGFFVFTAVQRSSSFVFTAVVTFFCTLAMSIAVESVQFFNLERGSAIWDIMSGAIGGGGALIAGKIWAIFSTRLELLLKRFICANPLLIVAVFLMAMLCWDAARPFYVISSTNALYDNIKRSVVIPFEPPGRDIREQLGLRHSTFFFEESRQMRTLDYWAKIAERIIAYGSLIGVLVYSCTMRSFWKVFGGYIVFLLNIEFISLLVVGGGGDITRLVVGLCVAPLAMAVNWCLRLCSKIHALFFLLILSLSYVFISDLRPYQFGSLTFPGPEWFVPLISHVKSIDVMQLANIVEAVVIFSPIGMLSYLILVEYKFRGQPNSWPTVCYSLFLCFFVAGFIELVQLWMPMRTSALEDILYATIGAYVGVFMAKYYLWFRMRSRSGCCFYPKTKVLTDENLIKSDN